MDTLAEIYKRHSGGTKFNDKNTIHSYLPIYEDILAPYRETGERVCEIGLFDGHSYRMFLEYFHNADVHGIDCDQQPHGGMADLRPLIAEYPHRVHIFDATDAKMVAEKFGGGNLFSLVIDDAAHNIEQQMQLIDVWRPYLSPGGIMITEDIQDLDRDRHRFEERGCEIVDLRKAKNRYDDVLAVWRKPA